MTEILHVQSDARDGADDKTEILHAQVDVREEPEEKTKSIPRYI